MNVLIISDKANPENNGKVMLYKIGQQIFDKIQLALHPKFDDIVAFNPYDPWEGANFKLRISKGDYGNDYSESSFDSISPISEDDDEIERIWKQEHDLGEFISPDQFKSYDDLKAQLDRVLGNTASIPRAAEDIAAGMQSDVDEDEQPASRPTRPAPAKPKPPVPPRQAAPATDDDEDEAAWFANMMND